MRRLHVQIFLFLVLNFSAFSSQDSCRSWLQFKANASRDSHKIASVISSADSYLLCGKDIAAITMKHSQFIDTLKIDNTNIDKLVDKKIMNIASIRAYFNNDSNITCEFEFTNHIGFRLVLKKLMLLRSRMAPSRISDKFIPQESNDKKTEDCTSHQTEMHSFQNAIPRSIDDYNQRQNPDVKNHQINNLTIDVSASSKILDMPIDDLPQPLTEEAIAVDKQPAVLPEPLVESGY